MRTFKMILAFEGIKNITVDAMTIEEAIAIVKETYHCPSYAIVKIKQV